MRGLKRIKINMPHTAKIVASFTDAWIETFFRRQEHWENTKSHLLQMRGLKQLTLSCKGFPLSRIFYRCVDWNFVAVPLVRSDGSHLLQMRGLKPGSVIADITVASRIFYRCVDWNRQAGNKTMLFVVASFTDAWIETNNVKVQQKSRTVSHLLQMRGLKRK